jgi:hypothetical protein
MFNQLKVNLWILGFEFINLEKNYAMKYLFVFLLIGLVGCGGATAEASAENKADATDLVEEPNTSGDQKIAENESKEYATVKIENLEIMAEDLGQMEWNEVNQKCAELGYGWRLPTKEELNFLYQNKETIGGFDNYEYWSSEQEGAQNDAWVQFFGNGYQYPNDEAEIPNARLVRDL